MCIRDRAAQVYEVHCAIDCGCIGRMYQEGKKDETKEMNVPATDSVRCCREYTLDIVGKLIFKYIQCRFFFCTEELCREMTSTKSAKSSQKFSNCWHPRMSTLFKSYILLHLYTLQCIVNIILIVTTCKNVSRQFQISSCLLYTSRCV